MVWGLALWAPLVWLGTPACQVKKTVKVQLPENILNAKTVSREELLLTLNGYSDNIRSLSSTDLKVSFTAGKVESGKLQEYRTAPAYILLRRPDAIRLNIQNPLTRTALVELVSQGDAFSIWYPRENKFYEGSNTAKELELDGKHAFSARPLHILEAILPRRIELTEPGAYLSVEEEQDANSKYYVLSLFKAVDNHLLLLQRKLWVERSMLAVAKQQVYDDSGGVVSVIRYRRLEATQGLLLPLSIDIERPQDGYELELDCKTWRLNPDLPETAFELTPPPQAQRVFLKEKGRTVNP